MSKEKQLINRQHHIDLARRKSDLESVFESVIDRIPDLLMPQCYRFAGEEDYFNATKGIKLRPFKKQRAFEASISPELSGAKSRLECPEVEEAMHERWSMRAKESSRESNSAERDESRCRSKAKVSFGGSPERAKARAIGGQISRPGGTETRIQPRDGASAKRRFSRIKLRRPEMAKDENSGFDRLFRGKPSREYPFANPMPDCMLTEENVDNLRELIVSAVDIEWKMLTPVRPNKEYEEKYFDELIRLHRQRYKTRLECGYFNENQRLPFKHTRHTFLLHYVKHRRSSSVPILYGAKLRRKFRSRGNNSRLGSRLSPNLTIPRLTLTSDESSNQPIGGGDLDSADSDLADDVREFDYGNFSRQQTRDLASKSSIESGSNSDQAFASEGSSPGLEIDDLLESQVEDIMTHLVDTRLF